jgi:hypothetical protein
LEQLPHLLGVRQAARLWREAMEEAVHVLDVPKQELSRVGVVCRVDGLGEVDDDRPFGAHEDVEVREIAVHDAGSEHAKNFANQSLVHRPRALGLEHQVGEAWRRVAIGVGDKLHDEHAVDEMLRHGHAHPGRV